MKTILGVPIVLVPKCDRCGKDVAPHESTGLFDVFCAMEDNEYIHALRALNRWERYISFSKDRHVQCSPSRMNMISPDMATRQAVGNTFCGFMHGREMRLHEVEHICSAAMRRLLKLKNSSQEHL